MNAPSAPEGQAPDPPSRKGLLLMTGGAIVVGALIVLGAVLPAEFNKDPLGLGKATGLSKLWAPAEVKVAATEGAQTLAREYPAPFRTDTFEIPLTGGDTGAGNELEFKVRMKKGATYIYSWSVPGVKNPEEFYYDFHGHTIPGPNEKMVVSEYKQATGTGGSGALVAPFDGIHGWYFQNQSLPPQTVTLKLAGFYELIPAGQVGNELGIQPKKP